MQFIEICLILGGALLLVLSVYLERKQRADTAPPASRQPPHALTPDNSLKLQSSLTDLLGQLQTLGQDVTVDLEGKLGELKELLHLADKKLEDLSEAKGKHVAPQPGKQLESNQPTVAMSSSPELEITIEDDCSSMPAMRYQQIYQMADDGLSVDEIARRSQMGKGEIQLILSLRKKD